MFSFERYTDRAKRVILHAHYEAAQHGSLQVESVHILLGLAREEWDIVNSFLGQRWSGESFRQEIEANTTIRPRSSTSNDIPFSDECRSILTYALEEAEQRKSIRVDSEHLLLGLLREQTSLAARIFQRANAPARHASMNEETHTREKIALQQLLRNILKAWDERDVKSFSQFFSEGGQLIDNRGELWAGRRDIEKAVSVRPTSLKASLAGWQIENVRFAAIDTAVAVAVRDEERITFVLHREADGWCALRAQQA